MAFNITFDFRFDSTGFFADDTRRQALEEAGAIWESLIADEFDNVAAGTSFSLRDPSTGERRAVTLTEEIDDLLIFVGATDLPGRTLATAGPDGFDAQGDVFSSRIASNFRGTGPVTDFEPWVGTIAFDRAADWSFALDAARPGQADFISVALHEIGHIFGIGTSAAFEALVANGMFDGVNARAVNGGQAVPLEADLSHVLDGFAGDTVLFDPILINGTRTLPSDIDLAMLADIGFETEGFVAQGSTPAITSDADDDPVFGTLLGDVIDGRAGDDRIMGQAGDDTLRGGPGMDTLFGGAGRDFFEIRAGDGSVTINDFDLSNEVVFLRQSGFSSIAEVLTSISQPFSNVSRLTLFDGTNVDIFHSNRSGTPLEARHFELIETVQNLERVGGPGPDILSGGEGNDTLTGRAGNDTLHGNNGNDELQGGVGFDVMRGNAGNDLLIGRNGFDTLEGGSGGDTLQGNAGDDVLSGSDDDDLLIGGIGSDEMGGDAGDDLLQGQGGFDTLNGGGGNDTLQGNNSNDELNGGAGNDLLEGGLGFDTLDGGAGDDLLLGANGFDILNGGAGNDRLEGNAGNDRLDGGIGNDILRGGIGADTFVFRVGYGADRVIDLGNVDTIELDAALLGVANPIVNDLREISRLDNDGFLVLDFGDGDTLTFIGITNTTAILDEVSFV